MLPLNTCCGKGGAIRCYDRFRCPACRGRVDWHIHVPAWRRSTTRVLAKADGILLSLRASAAPLIVYGRRPALSRALYAGAQVLFFPAMTLGS
jgi:hypothetical protein